MSTQYHHKDLRRALIQAALEVVKTQGHEAISVNALAREVGVSSGAPFRHFSSKTDLLAAVAEQAAGELVRVLEEASAGLEDGVEAARARGVAYVRYAVECPGCFRLVTDMKMLEASPALRALHGRGVEERTQAFGGGGMKELAAQALIFGLAQMCVEGHLGEVTPESAERLAWEVTHVLGVGLLRS